MRIFVTGASGFIGTAVTRELRDAGHHVVALARSEASAKVLDEAGYEVLRGSSTISRYCAAEPTTPTASSIWPLTTSGCAATSWNQFDRIKRRWRRC